MIMEISILTTIYMEITYKKRSYNNSDNSINNSMRHNQSFSFVLLGKQIWKGWKNHYTVLNFHHKYVCVWSMTRDKKKMIYV